MLSCSCEGNRSRFDELLHFVDLRAQLEAQLRCLAKAKRVFAAARRERSEERRANHRAEIVSQLAEIVSISSHVGETAHDACAQAQDLLRMREEGFSSAAFYAPTQRRRASESC